MAIGVVVHVEVVMIKNTLKSDDEKLPQIWSKIPLNLIKNTP